MWEYYYLQPLGWRYYIKILDNVLMRTLYLGVLEHTPQISRQLCNLVCFGAHFRDIFLKKIYNTICYLIFNLG